MLLLPRFAPADGLTADERIELEQLKDFHPRPSEGFKAWFFDFGAGPVEDGYTGVTIDDAYSKSRGWGWVFDSATQRPWKASTEPRPDVPYGYTYLGHGRAPLYRQTYDIFTPLETDRLAVFRRNGIAMSRLPDIGDLARSMTGSIYVKDDAAAEFHVDVPNGEYSLIMEVLADSWSQFTVQVQNEPPHLFVRRGNPKHRAMYVPVKDGKLRLRFAADRMSAAYYNGGVWGTGPGWNVCYVAIFDARDEAGFAREDWRIIKNKFFATKKAIYVNVNRLQSRIQDFAMVVDERPHWDAHLQNHFNPPLDKYLRFYSLGNALGGGALSTPLKKILMSNNYLAADRHEKSYYEDYPFELVDLLNESYKAGFFARPFFGGEQLEFMPKYLQGESPLMSSPDGRSLGRAPLGSKLQQELIREFLEFLSAHISDHPSLLGYELWEELEDLPAHFGYDPESAQNYQLWLQRKYTDIAALNRAWGTRHRSFEEIAPPPYAVYGGANYVNWQNFRGSVVGDDLKVCYDKIRQLQPWTLSVGGGSRPTTGDECTWDWLPAVDATFQYGHWLQKMMLPAQKHFAAQGHAVAVQSKTVDAGSSHAGGTSRNCPYTHFFSGIHRKSQNLRGRESPDRTPEETRKAVDACNGYNSIMHSLFHGMKSIMWEAQEGFADTHMVHYAKWYSDTLKQPGGEFRNEYNDLMFFSPEALEGPAVRICLPFLYVQRANEAIYRLAPLVLPAQPLEAEVGILATAESTFPVGERYTPGLSAFRIPLNNLSKLMDSLQTSAWGIREDIFDDVFKYKLIIAGPSVSAITKEQAEKLKTFVARGGRLVIINNGCSADGDTLYTQADSPIHRLDKLVGGKVVRQEGGVNQELREGEKESRPMEYASIAPYPGSTALLKDGDDVTAIRSADGKGYLIIDKRFGQGYYRDLADEASELRGILAQALKDAGVAPLASIEGAAQPEQIYVGALKGQDCWVLGFLNDALATQKFTARLNCLPPGDYSIIDITGQRPLLQFTKQKSWSLLPDPESRREKYLAPRISSAQLAAKGIDLDCVSKGGRILLVRSAASQVWVNMPEYEMIGLTFQYQRKDPAVDKRLDPRPERAPVRIILGSGAGDSLKARAREIVDLLSAAKISATIEADRDVKVKPTTTRVEVPTSPHDTGARPSRGDLYLMDAFKNEIIETDANLIVIGSETANATARQLAKDGAFAYDKVLIKVTDSFPGAGIGVIQVVESINNEAYDARHESRSAILISGSDESGTLKALDRFLGTMRAASKLNPRVVAEKYGFGLEKRPVYVKPRRKQ